MLALYFAFAGVLFCFGMFVLGVIGNMNSGGDGSYGAGYRSPWNGVILFGSYYLCGICASESLNVRFKRLAALMAHTVPLLGVIGTPIQVKAIGSDIIFYVILFGPFAAAWHSLLKSSEI